MILRRSFPPDRVADRHQTWLQLILPYLEQQAAADLWDVSRGNFYHQPYEARTHPVEVFLCPSSSREDLLVQRAHTGTLSAPTDDGGMFYGAASDYGACQGTQHLDGDGNIVPYPLPCPDQRNGAIVPADIGATYDRNNNCKQNIFFGLGTNEWKSQTSFRSITDGTTNTFLCGEVSKVMARLTHAYSGDYRVGSFVGYNYSLLPNGYDVPDDRYGVREGISLRDGSFGSIHPGIVLFAFVDGRVTSIQLDTDPLVLAAYATRGDGEVEAARSPN